MPEQKKKVTKVVTHGARLPKESVFKRISKSFFMTDGKNIQDYLIDDLIVPLIKKTISGTVDMILYGSTNSRNRYSNGYYNVTPTRVVSYNEMFSPQQKKQPSQISNASGYQNLVFDFRDDAEKVLNSMRQSIEQFDIVSAGDMYDMADVSTTNYMLNNYGWSNLKGVTVVRRGDGFVIDLPAPSPIK